MKRNLSLKSKMMCSGALALTAVGGITAPAMAEEPETMKASEIASISAFWSDHGVESSTQDALLSNIEAGILPQSVVGGAEPSDVRVVEAEGSVTTLEIYPDGSITESSAEYPVTFAEEGGESSAARGIANCQSAIGTGYASRNNCNVTGTNGVVTLGFIGSYTLVQGGFDYITNHHTPIVACAPGTCSDPGFTQYVAQETAYSTAGVTATTVYSAADYGSITNILNLIVGNDSGRTTFSPGSIG